MQQTILYGYLAFLNDVTLNFPMYNQMTQFSLLRISDSFCIGAHEHVNPQSKC